MAVALAVGVLDMQRVAVLAVIDHFAVLRAAVLAKAQTDANYPRQGYATVLAERLGLLRCLRETAILKCRYQSSPSSCGLHTTPCHGNNQSVRSCTYRSRSMIPLSLP